MTGTSFALEPSPKRRDVDEVDSDQDDDDGEDDGACPEHPLGQGHVADVGGVHAEDACDERQWEEYYSDDGEDHCGVVAPVLHAQDLRSGLCTY